ncbi:MAG: hypothetical protein V3U78_01805 [Thiotrichaceae bacterium]
MTIIAGDEDENGDGSDLIGEIILDNDDTANTDTTTSDAGSNDSRTRVSRGVLAARVKRESIDMIYKNVVKSVKETLEENDVVDIELTFKASSVHKGIPIISRNQDSSVVEIRLATRISGGTKKETDEPS